jgi:hypothetical protein
MRRNRPTWLRTTVLLLTALPLSGCVGLALQGARAAKDAGERSADFDKARAGDAKAEYDVGMSWCCTIDGIGAPIYDNEKATEWLCKAARQDYGPAQFALARIYSGRMRKGGLKKMILSSIAPGPKDLVSALMWAKLAKGHEINGAADLQAEIEKTATSVERTEAARLGSGWRSAPCTWREVFAQSLGNPPRPPITGGERG